MGGMPADARAAFGNLLAGALHGTARGVHAEVIDDSGRRLVVLRPAPGPPPRRRLAAANVTEQYRTYDGRIDLLSSQFGRGTVTRISADDLRSRTPRNGAIRTLSAIDQVTL